jgi:hypothetical protein
LDKIQIPVVSPKSSKTIVDLTDCEYKYQLQMDVIREQLSINFQEENEFYQYFYENYFEFDPQNEFENIQTLSQMVFILIRPTKELAKIYFHVNASIDDILEAYFLKLE